MMARKMADLLSSPAGIVEKGDGPAPKRGVWARFIGQKRFFPASGNFRTATRDALRIAAPWREATGFDEGRPVC
jgi:hypothetical protein